VRDGVPDDAVREVEVKFVLWFQWSHDTTPDEIECDTFDELHRAWLHFATQPGGCPWKLRMVYRPAA
jgi:hypothetical protein